MEALGAILARLVPCMGSEAAGPDEPPAPGPACPRCGDAGVVRRDVPVGHPDFGRAVRCACAAGQARAWTAAGLTAAQQAQTFATFRARPGVAAALAAARAWAQAPTGWLVLLGPPGTGKTHLLSAIAHQVLAAGGRVRYWQAGELLAWWRAGLEPEADPPYAARYARVAQAAVLLLDDLGAERLTDWALEQWQQLLDARYRAAAPTALASNLTLAQLAAALGDRLASRLRDARLVRLRGLQATDWRAQPAPPPEEEQHGDR